MMRVEETRPYHNLQEQVNQKHRIERDLFVYTCPHTLELKFSGNPDSLPMAFEVEL